MQIKQESIFTSSVRSFFVALFVCLGIFVALIPALGFIGAIFGNDHERGRSRVEVLPYYDNLQAELDASSPLILQIDLQGIIGENHLTRDSIHRLLMDSLEVVDYQRIKGLVLNIRTPGGTQMDSDGIYWEIRRYKDVLGIPVAAYVDGLCASGGMYAACAADKIYASEVSLIGSVGVMGNFMNVSGLFEKVGLESLTLTAGKHKDLLNPTRPWRLGEQDSIQKLLDKAYEQFVDIVTEARPINHQLLINEYGAQVFPALGAKERGFIDTITNHLEHAVAEIASTQNLESGEYQVIRLTHQNWLGDILFAKNSLLKGTVEHKLTLPFQLPKAETEHVYYLYQP